MWFFLVHIRTAGRSRTVRGEPRARDWEEFELLLSDIELVHTEVFTPDAINNVIFEQPREHQFKCFYNIEDKEMVIETAVFNVEGEDEDLGTREWSETARNGSFIGKDTV